MSDLSLATPRAYRRPSTRRMQVLALLLALVAGLILLTVDAVDEMLMDAHEADIMIGGPAVED